MAPYLMAENPDLGVLEALRMSKYMMQGHKGRLFVLHLSFIVWFLLVGLTAGIGSIFLNPYLQSTQAAFFLDLLGRKSPYYNNFNNYNSYDSNGYDYHNN